jgi:hypothetical protein
MAIEINNNTIIRLIVRRGTEVDRSLATLQTGELAYTIDSQRLYVGVDGQVGTGVVAGNKFLGITSNRLLLTDIAQPGDTLFDTNANCMFALTASQQWANISPLLYNLEYTTLGTRVNASIAGTGFNLAYPDQTPSNIYSDNNGHIQLDSVYWSIDSANNNRLYLGNVNNNTRASFPDGRLIVDGSVYVDGTNNGSGQILLSAGTVGTSINFINSAGSTAAAFGKTYFNVASTVDFNANAPISLALQTVSAYPGFKFAGGCGIFKNGLVVQGGALIDSLSTVQSTVINLSSLHIDNTLSSGMTALLVTNNGANYNSNFVNFNSNGHDSIFVSTHPFVGIHTKATGYFPTYNTVISGTTLHSGNFSVSGNTTVYGDISATGDIIGFFSSDVALKQNINPITNALDKLLSLKGVEFDWNDKSIYHGHDVGVLAQDVENVLPSAVGTRHDGYKGVQYDKIIPLLIEAIRELKHSK